MRKTFLGTLSFSCKSLRDHNRSELDIGRCQEYWNDKRAGSRVSSAASLVAVHGHALGASAHLAVGRWADWSAAVALGAALLQGQELLSAEGLVVDLRRRLDEILQVGAEQEVSEVDKLAVVLVLNVDDAPAVLSGWDLLAVHDDRLLRADDSEGNQVLHELG